MEKVSTLISTKTSLPPGLEGVANGYLKLHVPFVTLNKSIGPNDTISVKARWWGEKSCTTFKPLSNGKAQQLDLKTIAIFTVKCSLEMILSYLKDMKLLKFEVVSYFGRACQRIGFAHVDLESVKFGVPVAKLYPIQLNNDVKGEAFISLSLEDFKSVPEKENCVSISSQDNNVRVTSLRKDTNDVLNKILSKAKDLRDCLESTRHSHISQPNNQSTIVQLLLDKNGVRTKQLQSSNFSDDSLPEDSVLNSVIYNKANSESFGNKKVTTSSEMCQTEHIENNAFGSLSRFDIGTQSEPESYSLHQTLPKTLTRNDHSDVNLLKDFSYFKVTVDSLDVGSSMRNDGWIYSIEVRVPWLGRDSAITWNSKGHRTYSDVSVFHLLSEKVGEQSVIFKQDRIFPFYYCDKLASKQFEKQIGFVVERRHPNKRTKQHLGKYNITLKDVISPEMSLSTTVKLANDICDPGTVSDYYLKVELQFLKITKRIPEIHHITTKALKAIETKEPLSSHNTKQSHCDPVINEQIEKPKLLNKSVQPDSETNCKVQSDVTLKKVVDSTHQHCDRYKNSPFEVLICIYEAYHLPIIYDSQSNKYHQPSTYITCKINHGQLCTHVVSNTSQPVWNFTQKAVVDTDHFLVFKIHLAHGNKLNLDKDRILGIACIDLRPLMHQNDHHCGTCLINNEVGDNCGELKVFIWPLQKNCGASLNQHATCVQKLKSLLQTRLGSNASDTNGSVKSLELKPPRLKVSEFLKRSVLNLNC